MITAGRLPLARDELRASWLTGLTAMLTASARAGQPAVTPWVDGAPERLDAYTRRLALWLEVAALYVVTDDMTTVAAQAGASLPRYELHADDPPDRIGLVVWAHPVAVVAQPHHGTVHVVGALWGPAVDELGRPSTHVVTLCDSMVFAASAELDEDTRTAVRTVAPLLYHDEATLPHVMVPELAMANEALRATLATWLLCGQRIAAVEQSPVERGVRRAYVRAQRPAPTVRTVSLRMPIRVSDPDAGGGPGRDYQHRWVVSGHWRQHWYPAQERHKPLYIASYVKGPEGAPLIGGERVNVLRR